MDWNEIQVHENVYMNETNSQPSWRNKLDK